VLTFVCGFGIVMGPIAWTMGNGVRRDALAAGWPEPGNNKGGRICGIIGTVMLVLAIVLVILVAALGNT
jgi:hypothetical protein